MSPMRRCRMVMPSIMHSKIISRGVLGTSVVAFVGVVNEKR
jgi:hypothetical protein